MTRSKEEVRAAVEKLIHGDKPVYPPLKEGATDEEFLLWLRDDLWEKKRGYDRLRPHGYDWYDERRKILKTELTRVKEAIKSLHLIVEPVNACMGFNFGINIYKPDLTPDEEEFALGHGIKLKATCILSITGHHTDTRFTDTWDLLSPLSHNPKNKALLRRYGFEEPREAGYYDY